MASPKPPPAGPWDEDSWGPLPPRCSHGRIILGCPDDDCPDQNAYLARQYAQLVLWDAQLELDTVEALTSTGRGEAVDPPGSR